jgi:hypothetical protein
MMKVGLKSEPAGRLQISTYKLYLNNKSFKILDNGNELYTSLHKI